MHIAVLGGGPIGLEMAVAGVRCVKEWPVRYIPQRLSDMTGADGSIFRILNCQFSGSCGIMP